MVLSLALVLLFVYVSRAVEDMNLDELKEATSAGKIMMVEFYAPWCHHCTDLFPVLDELGEEMEAKHGNAVVVAKMDAIKYKKELEEAGLGVSGYPTIRLWYESEWHKYNGSRAKENLADVIKRVRAPTLLRFKSLALLEDGPSDLEEEDIIFAFQPGRAKSSVGHGAHVASIFEETARQYKLAATFVVLKQSGSNADPCILKLVRHPEHDQGATGTKGFRVQLERTFDEQLTQEDVNSWVEVHNHGILTTFDNGNFKRLAGLGKLIVAAIIDGPEESHFAIDFESAVVGHHELSHTKVVFGFLDGSRWKQFTRKYNVPVPSLLVMDLASKKQFTQKLPISSSEMNYIFDRAIGGTLEMKSSASGSWWAHLVSQWHYYYPWSILFLLPFFLLILAIFNPVPRKEHLD